MDNNELSDENAALCTDIVRNFSYLKNSWPQIGFREHSISADIPIPNAELRERVRGAAAEKQDPTGEAWIYDGELISYCIRRIYNVYNRVGNLKS